MINAVENNGLSYDYLIFRSGIIGRQILRLCRFIHEKDEYKFDRPKGIGGFFIRQKWLRNILGIRAVSSILSAFYTYYVGGSLTRSDQLTFAKLHDMKDKAYRLTLFNALFFGIPCALGYFLLGEGFHLLKGIHSYVELPSLLARHTSLGIGLVSFSVDMFRAVDSALNHRSWAPFGFMPIAINLPTYLKRIFQKAPSKPTDGKPGRQIKTQMADTCTLRR